MRPPPFSIQSRLKFTPLTDSDLPKSWQKDYPHLQPHEVSLRLKKCRKPKSMIEGDIFPQLVDSFSDILAIPLTKIYNLTMWTYNWPRQWKMETVTVIPKTPNAETYEDCRNLSCTPLFSKVLEAFMMDRINSEVKIDPKQYGGLKGCGPEHLLLQAWDNLLNDLENNRGSVNMITIDFSKAFNRTSHQACIAAFHKKGASHQTLNLIAAFLSGRQMRVKVNQKYSKPLAINGGSPQGSVSANALFCATIQFLQEGDLEETQTTADNSLFDQSGDSSLYPGDTILGDLHDDSCVDFELNGWEATLSENSISDQNWGTIGDPSEEFQPRVFSTPQVAGEINYSSHKRTESTLSYDMNSSLHQRHQAGLARKQRIFDTRSDCEE